MTGYFLKSYVCQLNENMGQDSCVLRIKNAGASMIKSGYMQRIGNPLAENNT